MKTHFCLGLEERPADSADCGPRGAVGAAIALIPIALMMSSCTGRSAPSTPSPVGANSPAASVAQAQPASTHVHTMTSDDKGYLDGWSGGETVHLYYTKTYFCAEPPESGATSNCEIGAGPEVPPRPGPIPTIYAIAAVGIHPDPSTLACPGGSVCLDHPAMIDVSRLRGPGFENSPGLPHSHIVTERHGGWFNTVNIRVADIDVWNDIARTKSLDRVRELQADPEIGGKGKISQDTPTNIYFFIASWRVDQ